MNVSSGEDPEGLRMPKWIREMMNEKSRSFAEIEEERAQAKREYADNTNKTRPIWIDVKQEILKAVSEMNGQLGHEAFNVTEGSDQIAVHGAKNPSHRMDATISVVEHVLPLDKALARIWFRPAMKPSRFSKAASLEHYDIERHWLYGTRLTGLRKSGGMRPVSAATLVQEVFSEFFGLT